MPIFPLLEELPLKFRTTNAALKLRSINHLLILPFLNGRLDDALLIDTGPSASEDHLLVLVTWNAYTTLCTSPHFCSCPILVFGNGFPLNLRVEIELPILLLLEGLPTEATTNSALQL